MWILNNDQLQNLLTICQSNNYNKEDQELFSMLLKHVLINDYQLVF